MYQNWVIWGQSPFVSAAAESQIGHKIIGDFLFDRDGFLFELSAIVFFLTLACRSWRRSKVVGHDRNHNLLVPVGLGPDQARLELFAAVG